MGNSGALRGDLKFAIRRLLDRVWFLRSVWGKLLWSFGVASVIVTLLLTPYGVFGVLALSVVVNVWLVIEMAVMHGEYRERYSELESERRDDERKISKESQTRLQKLDEAIVQGERLQGQVAQVMEEKLEEPRLRNPRVRRFEKEVAVWIDNLEYFTAHGEVEAYVERPEFGAKKMDGAMMVDHYLPRLRALRARVDV